LESVYTNAVDN